MKTKTIVKTKMYNKSEVMKNAWIIFKKGNGSITWPDALKQAWNVAKNGIEKITIEFLYKTYYKEIYNHIFFKINYKKEIAEEITNDVFLKANEHLLNYDVYKAGVRTWLYTITKNKIIDFYRSNAKNNNISHVSDWTDSEGKELYSFTSNDYSDSDTENNELLESINKAMNNLKPQQKQVAESYFIDNRQYSEIVDLTGLSLSNVKVIIHRIRESLQSTLSHVYELNKQD
jgi:RNA polymerase sigma-70 factor (ECF subfamily)